MGRPSTIGYAAAILIASTLATAAVAQAPTPAPAPAPAAPTYSITLGPRTACVTPRVERQGRADGGFIDVVTPGPNVLTMAMTGAVAANAFLGHASTATETFHLEQEFAVDCSDPAVDSTRLTLESALTGFVRSRSRAGAAARLASAKVCLPGSPETPLVVVHPPLAVLGEDGRLCNQHLPLIRVDRMPVGRYVLVADFVLTCDAGGLLDGHSAADFSPSTALPSDWVRSRDPFQGVDKKDFGFKLVLTADPPEKEKAVALAPKLKDGKIARTSAVTPTPTPARAVAKATATGLGRHGGPR